MSSLRKTFTTAEAAALSMMSDKRVRKELETSVVDAPSPRELPFSALVYLEVLRQSQLELRVAQRQKLYQVLKDWMNAPTRESRLSWSPVVTFEVGAVADELNQRWERFSAWKDARVVLDPTVMGGAPVFKGTRLTLERLAGLLAGGEERDDVLSDYPELTSEDMEFAPLYVKAYPRVGRPRHVANRQFAT